jgi:hypothetical protein
MGAFALQSNQEWNLMDLLNGLASIESFCTWHDFAIQCTFDGDAAN